MNELSVPQWDSIGPYLSWEDRVAFIAYRLSLLPPSAEAPVTEIFENGFYIRVMTIPKGTFIIGRKHLKPHKMVLSKGSAIMCLKNGNKVLFTAPFSIDTEPGFQSVALTLEDTVVYTMYETEEKSFKVLESEAFEAADVVLKQGKVVSDQFDYQNLLKEYNLHDSDIRRLINRTDDMKEWYGAWYKQKSPVEGIGIFADYDFIPGDQIGPARLEGRRTPLGRYVNHSSSPNAEMSTDSHGDIFLKAIKPIARREEIFTDYHKIIEFNPELRNLLCQVQ